MEKIKELRKEEEQKAISQNILEKDNSFHKKNCDEKSTIILKEDNKEKEKGIKKIKFLSRNQRKEIGKENNFKKRKRNKSQTDKGKGKED